MDIINEENILKLLYSYNPWWNTDIISTDFAKEMKRFAFFEAKEKLFNKDIRRTVVLSGARRTGKTTIMYQMVEYLLKEDISSKNILFISFDHPLLKMCSVDRILEVYNQNISNDKEVYCFFDEIQYSSDWDSWLKIIYDTKQSYKVMATGSASPMFCDRQAESGLGRWVLVQVPTLSFYEYCELLKIEVPALPKGIKPTQLYLLDKIEQNSVIRSLAHLQIHFIRYLQVGGFPELALSQNDTYSQRILREDIVDKALKRDLPSVYKIRNIVDLEKIFLYLCYYSSNIINIEAVTKELNGISRATVENYIKYLENSNLIYTSKSISIKGKKVLKSQQKIFIADAAIRNAVLMNDDIIADAAEMGIIVETAVNKHIRTFYYNTIAEIGYYRDTVSNKEIDIVVIVPKASPIMIEVKYREGAPIKKTDAIVTMQEGIPNLVITKNAEDNGIFDYEGKQIYKIPAFAFLYLLGHAEKQGYKK